MGAKPTIMPRKPGHVKVTDTEAAKRFLSEVAEPTKVEHLKVESSEVCPVGVMTASDSSPTSTLMGHPKKRVLTRSRDGKTVRQVTAYLPVPLSKALAHYCAEHDREKSEVIVLAVEAFLQDSL